jgi:hypothetical protein
MGALGWLGFCFYQSVRGVQKPQAEGAAGSGDKAAAGGASGTGGAAAPASSGGGGLMGGLGKLRNMV